MINCICGRFIFLVDYLNPLCIFEARNQVYLYSIIALMNIEKILYIVISTVIVAIFIVFTFVFSISAPDTTGTSKVKTIYYVDNISPAHQKVIELFNRKYEGAIRVETINLSFDKFSTNERKELLARYLRSKNDRIDIFSVDQIWVPRFARWAVPLNELIDSSEIVNLIPNALETCYYKDTLVALPLYIDVSVMLYREDLIKKLPGHKKFIEDLERTITWEQLINYKPIENNYPFYTFQADDYEGLVCAFTELMANQKNPVIDKDGNIYINTIEGKKSLSLLVNLVNKYNISPKEVCNFKENESFKYFIKNDGLFLRAWSSMIDDENNFISDELRGNIKIAPLPYFSGTSPASVYGGWNLMISRFSDKLPEVTKFIKFLMTEESQKIMYEEGAYLPINKKLYEDVEYIEKQRNLVFFKNLFKSGIHRPFIINYTNVSDILSFYLNMAIEGKISVDEALSEADTKIRQKAILVK
jgi:multiple sugar transport system substrate-binding protein